jgi:hypothetical protein
VLIAQPQWPVIVAALPILLAVANARRKGASSTPINHDASIIDTVIR